MASASLSKAGALFDKSSSSASSMKNSESDERIDDSVSISSLVDLSARGIDVSAYKPALEPIFLRSIIATASPEFSLLSAK